MTSTSNYTGHPWYGRIKAAGQGSGNDGFRPLTEIDLGRLAPEKRARLMELLEQDALERAAMPPHPGPDLFDAQFRTYIEEAEATDDAEKYWTALEAHRKSERQHFDRLQAARPKWEAGQPIEALVGGILEDMKEADRLAAADGFAYPG